MKKITITVTIAILCVGCAGAPKRTQVGPGTYMITGQNNTVFGSYHSKVAELMQLANDHCSERGLGATMVDADGRDSRVGNPLGLLPSAGQTAAASVIYRCE